MEAFVNNSNSPYIAETSNILPTYGGSTPYRKSSMTPKQIKARKRAKHNKKLKH